MDALGIARVGVEGFEADDVIATLARASTMPVDIVTGDRDLFQLAEDSRPTTIVYIGKGFAKAERVTDAFVREKYGDPRSLVRRLRDAARRSLGRPAGCSGRR